MENYISINDAIKRYGKSLSTIKKVIKTAKGNDIKRGERLNTGSYKVLISVSYLDSHFITIEEPTANTTQSDIVDLLENQLKNQQKTIEKLLQNQEAFLENERNFQILLERANQRNDLLEQHFDRNKNLTVSPQDKKEEIEIEELRDEPTLDSKFISTTDDKTMNEWLKMLKETRD